MNANDIAKSLRARPSGKGWMACCPAHEDRNPSLHICEHEGKVLVKCFAGCDQADVVAALKGRGLWPEAERREHPQEWGRIVRPIRTEEFSSAAARWHERLEVGLRQGPPSAVSTAGIVGSAHPVHCRG
ncbi:MAG: CHC2 zinc finger domain-containing protein [Acidobacteria bacterium]|nr:CHC2 zinc finger domain-containing protein [Acidobacteriota bacterium]